MQYQRTMIIWSLLILICSGGWINAQQQTQEEMRRNRERMRFRQAQRYQQNGDHENAIKILRQLYGGNRGNFQYYSYLLRSYLQLSELEPAAELIEQQKKSDPGNPQYTVDYASLLYKSEQREEALKLWQQVIDEHRDSATAHTIVANAMASHRLYDQAAAVYRTAVDRFPDRPHLLRTLADYYRQLLRYYDALPAYIAYIKQDPKSYQGVIRQVLSFRVEGGQIDTLAQIMTQAARKSKDVVEIQLLSAKFFQKHQRYDRALEIYRQIENENSKGRYLIEFANAVYADSVYELSLIAYEDVITRFAGSNFVLPAYLGAAECNLAIAESRNDQAYARKSLEMIANVQQNYPGHAQVARLTLLEGDIHRKFFFDIDKAIAIYEDVARHYRHNQGTRDAALLKAGEAYITRGDLDSARERLDGVTMAAGKPAADLLKAKIEYYRGNYDNARTLAEAILQQEGLAGTMANDALRLQSILMIAAEAPQAVSFYAQADWLLFQEKKSEAISKLESAIEENAPPHFQIRLIFDAARLATEIGKYPEALAFCNRVLQERALALYADEALFLMAGIFDDKLRDAAEAFRMYDRILVEYPDSQFAIPSRDRLKELRVSNPELMP